MQCFISHAFSCLIVAFRLNPFRFPAAHTFVDCLFATSPQPTETAQEEQTLIRNLKSVVIFNVARLFMIGDDMSTQRLIDSVLVFDATNPVNLGKMLQTGEDAWCGVSTDGPREIDRQIDRLSH